MALMPNRQRSSYDTLFNTVRQHLIAQYNTIGSINGGFIHTDHELGAINSSHATFPEAFNKTCGFHFAKSIITRIREIGLMELYQRDVTRGYDVFPYRSFRSYVRRIISMMLLPENCVYPCWLSNFRTPQPMNDPLLDAQIANFVTYMENQWVNAHKIPLWNHQGHDGPKTTNHAEGYNNSLRSKLPVSVSKQIVI